MKLRLTISIMLLSLLTAVSAWGETVKLVSVSPAEGETVSSLDVALLFDIEEAAVSIDWEDLCCIYGKLTFTYYTGYGTDNQIELASKTVTYNGKTEGAKYSKLQEIYVPAPNETHLIEGEKYTITISGTVGLSKIGSSAYKTTVKLEFNNENMLVVPCVGGKPDPSSFYFVSSSLDEAEPQVKIPEFTITFSQPVSIVGEKMPYINKSTTLFATAVGAKVKADDPCSIVLSFGEEQLWKGSYTVVIPKGYVCQVDKPERTNNPIELTMTSEYLEYFYPKTTKPEINGVGLEETYFIEFDMQDDWKIGTTPVKTDVYLYENEVSDENLCGTFAVELRGSSFFPHELEISISYSYKPATKYIFVLPQDVITVQSKYSNSRVEIPFTTPTIEAAGFAPMSFVAANGKYSEYVANVELTDGMSVDRLKTVDLRLSKYQYGGEHELGYEPAEDSEITDAILYDITSGERKEVKRAPLSRKKRETTNFAFYVLTMDINTDLYAEHEYELVIPTKETRVTLTYCNFITKPDEFVVKLKGSTPVGEPKPLVCSLSENQQLEALHTVHWTFPTGFAVAASDPKAKIELSETETREGWLSMTTDEEGSYLTAIFSDRRNGAPVTLAPGQNATVVLPAGTVVFAGLPDEVYNEEIRIGVTGEQPVDPETVRVEVIAAGQLTSSSEALKGKNFTLQLAPDEYWEVSKLSCNDTDVTAELKDGTYSTASLDEDSTFEVGLGYTGEIVIADESGVAEIADAGLKVCKEGETVVIEGTQSGDKIVVYTVGGQQIATHTATDDIVRLTLTGGAIYIIRINDRAVKIAL